MWLEVEGPWELNRQKEAEASVWEGAEMSLGFDWRRRASFSDDEQALATTSKLQRRRRANVTTVKANDLATTTNDLVASKCDNGERFGEIVANWFGVGIIWMLRMALGCCEWHWAVRERVREREK